MRRIIVIVALLAVVGIGGFLFIFKREALLDLGSSARGYPKAKTAQECCDLFQKALRERKYEMAGRYCTKDYAEQLKRGNDAAVELGEAIDGVMHRVKSEINPDDKTATEIEAILRFYDPFPTNVKITLKDSSDKEATALMTFEGPLFNATTGTKKWDDNGFWNAYFGEVFHPMTIKLVKESDGWKMDIPKVQTDAVRARVEKMNGKYKDYVNSFKKMAEEMRVERTTKADATNRMHELMLDAAK